MNINKVLQFVFVGGILVILGFMGVYAYQQQALLRLMDVKYGGVKINKLSLSSVSLVVTLNLNNASGLAITIQSYNFDVLINGNKVMNLIAPGAIGIAANSVSQIKLAIDFNPLVVLKGVFSNSVLVNLFTDYSGVIIGIKGVMTIFHGGITIPNYPVELTETLADIMKLNAGTTS